MQNHHVENVLISRYSAEQTPGTETVGPTSARPVALSPHLQDGEQLIRLPKLLIRLGVSRSTVYRRVKNGEMPAPVHPSPRCTAWKLSEVDSWMAQLGK